MTRNEETGQGLADATLARACRTAALTVFVSTLLLLMLLHAAPAAHAAEVRVVIEDVRSTSGVLRVQVLTATDAGEGPTVAQLMLPAVKPQVRATLHDLEPGRYAARVHHDLDGDGEMATNLVGMPTEPWGVSNDARGRFGPPPFQDMVVEVGVDGGELRMTLVH